VLYVNSEDLRRALEYDLEQEKNFSYKGLSMDDVMAHIAKFVSGIWQIHPFGEGTPPHYGCLYYKVFTQHWF